MTGFKAGSRAGHQNDIETHQCVYGALALILNENAQDTRRATRFWPVLYLVMRDLFAGWERWCALLTIRGNTSEISYSIL